MEIDEMAFAEALENAASGYETVSAKSVRAIIEAYETAKAKEQPDEFILKQIVSEIDDAGEGKIPPERLMEAAEFCMQFIKRQPAQPDDYTLRGKMNTAYRDATGEVPHSEGIQAAFEVVRPYLRQSERESVNQKMLAFIKDLATREPKGDSDYTGVFKSWIDSAQKLVVHVEEQGRRG